MRASWKNWRHCGKRSAANCKPHEQAGTDGDELYTELAAFAKERNVFLLAGSMPIRADEDFITLVVTRPGEIARYDKVHLFSLLAEPKHFAAGDRRVTGEYGGYSGGACDLLRSALPGIVPQLALDARLLVPAEWPESRLLVWVN